VDAGLPSSVREVREEEHNPVTAPHRTHTQAATVADGYHLVITDMERVWVHSATGASFTEEQQVHHRELRAAYMCTLAYVLTFGGIDSCSDDRSRQHQNAIHSQQAASRGR